MQDHFLYVLRCGLIIVECSEQVMEEPGNSQTREW